MNNYLEWVLLQIALFQCALSALLLLHTKCIIKKYFKKGIYKLFSKQVDQIFNLFSKDIVFAGLVEGIT